MGSDEKKWEQFKHSEFLSRRYEPSSEEYVRAITHIADLEHRIADLEHRIALAESLLREVEADGDLKRSSRDLYTRIVSFNAKEAGR